MVQQISLSPFFIVLVEPRIAGNMGAVARAMMNMGFENLSLVSPRADPLSPECLQRAVDAEKIMRGVQVYSSLKEATQECQWIVGTTRKTRHQRFDIVTPRDFAKKALRFRKRKVALVFGTEDKGLSNADLLLCDQVIQIPSSSKYPSINLSHAVMIVLYEIFSQFPENRKILSQKREIPKATAKKREEFYDHLKEALLSIEFLDKNNPDHIMRDLRNIFSRASLDERELSILRGICRQVINRYIILKYET